MTNLSKDALTRQYKVFACVLAFITAIIIAFFWFTPASTSSQIRPQAKVELPGDKINPQDIWMSKIDSEGKVLEKRLKYLEDLILDTKRNEEEQVKENESLKQEISRLKSTLKSVSDQAQIQRQTFEATLAESKILSQQVQSTLGYDCSNYSDTVITRPLLKELVMGKPPKQTFNVEQAIPAGTTVQAVLVSSVDAPCGVYSASDPIPVKLRILDNGHLPHEVVAKLKGGLLIASAYGDISAERVYMRLERLTMVETSGEFVETQIAGFVSGEDGKYGLRGAVVDKSSRLVCNAAYSGFFSGVSQFLTTALVATESNCCCGNNLAAMELLEAGAADGASHAFDALADYYIKRAEQILPVIEVTAGRIVDITFTHQADLGDLYTQDKVREVRERNCGRVTDRGVGHG